MKNIRKENMPLPNSQPDDRNTSENDWNDDDKTTQEKAEEKEDKEASEINNEEDLA